MHTFKTVGIIVKTGDDRLKTPLGQLLSHLEKRQLTTLLDSTLIDMGIAPEQTVHREALSSADLVIVVGGDGTLLDAARSLAEYSIPLLGINMGRLGFLVDVSPHEIGSKLDEVFNGGYYDERRAMLLAHVMEGEQVIFSSYALNDVVIHVRDAVRMIEFETRIDGRFVHQQRADGIVINTPTGSTAYALSGGGPLLHPELDVVSLVPICPHTLSNRPIVVSGNSEIEIRLSATNRTPAQVSFDGQSNVELKSHQRVLIQKKPRALHLIHPEDYDYFEILREKLHWHAHL
ncbi:MAG: NAD(+) kinase [bacterium]